MVEYLRREKSELRVRILLKSKTVQPPYLVWMGTLVALYEHEGLLVAL